MAIARAEVRVVRSATPCTRVVWIASARLMAGEIVAGRRASLDVPVPGGSSDSTLWSQHLHRLQFRRRLEASEKASLLTCSRSRIGSRTHITTALQAAPWPLASWWRQTPLCSAEYVPDHLGDLARFAMRIVTRSPHLSGGEWIGGA
jgi:hypothetical protein